MKNIIPFKKDVIFKNKLGEITSISLENTLKMIDGVIDGDFIISGEYKKDLDSKESEPFNLEIPFKSVIEERFITDNAIIDIDDFFYEIKDNNTLSISIDILVDRLEEKPLIKIDDKPEIEEKETIDIFKEIDTRETSIEEKENSNDIKEEIKDKITTIFNTDNNEETYVTYNVCIVRDKDTLESILEKYNISKEEVEKYNNISELKIGDKLLIPSENE